jgi:mRNA deadenylase 3'-5' endonuclease subunit Ccr4
MWLNTTNQEYFRQNHQQYFKFNLVCYNILAQNLLHENMYLYGNCWKKNLQWYRRRDRLGRELLRQDADVSGMKFI